MVEFFCHHSTSEPKKPLAACKDLRDISYKALKSRLFTLPVKELEAIFER